jgi:RNA polymerase sigma-70 factor (ECF subfamily)
MLRARPRSITLPLSVPTADSPSTRAGDTGKLFERLYAEHQPPILNYLYRLVGDAALAEDLVQEAFTRAWRARAQLAGVENPRAWLYRIATNAARDHLRRARLLRWLPLAPGNAQLAVAGPEEASLEAARMQQALLKLDPDYRIPLVLYTCQESSVAEIAAVLGLTTDAVKQRLSRARQKLREAYRP